MRIIGIGALAATFVVTSCGAGGMAPARPPLATVTVTAAAPETSTATPTRESTSQPPEFSPTTTRSARASENADSSVAEDNKKPRVYDSLFDGCPSTIKKGQSGRCVLILQMRLNVHGFYVVEDGEFGSRTDRAVRDFQNSVGIAVDGLVGTQTKTYLGG